MQYTGFFQNYQNKWYITQWKCVPDYHKQRRYQSAKSWTRSLLFVSCFLCCPISFAHFIQFTCKLQWFLPKPSKQLWHHKKHLKKQRLLEYRRAGCNCDSLQNVMFLFFRVIRYASILLLIYFILIVTYIDFCQKLPKQQTETKTWFFIHSEQSTPNKI